MGMVYNDKILQYTIFLLLAIFSVIWARWRRWYLGWGYSLLCWSSGVVETKQA